MADVVYRYLTLGLARRAAALPVCSRYVAGDPQRFRTLLTEQVCVADLLAAPA